MAKPVKGKARSQSRTCHSSVNCNLIFLKEIIINRTFVFWRGGESMRVISEAKLASGAESFVTEARTDSFTFTIIFWAAWFPCYQKSPFRSCQW